jgi:hypothetical protein
MLRLACSVLVLVCGVSACDKASVQQCDKGCRNYFTLHYWEEVEAELATLPEAARAPRRIEAQAQLETRMMQNLDLCIQKCKSGADDERVDCWIRARTTTEAKRCASQ